MFSHCIKRRWFSGKIQRCHRWAPGSIPGRRKNCHLHADTSSNLSAMGHTVFPSPQPEHIRHAVQVLNRTSALDKQTDFLNHLAPGLVRFPQEVQPFLAGACLL